MMKKVNVLQWIVGALLCGGMPFLFSGGHALAKTASEQNGSWTLKQCAAYLGETNSREAILVKKLTVTQGESPLQIYRQTGNEEKRRNINERPILTPTLSGGPFVRGVEYVVRVNRSRGLKLTLELDKIAEMADRKEGVELQPVREIFVYIKPGEEEQVYRDRQGKYAINLDRSSHVGKVKVQIRSGDERHTLLLRIMNDKKAFTLEPRAH